MPAPGRSADEAARAISGATGLRAVTEAQFKKMSERWLLFNSPIPIVVGLFVVVGLIIGLGLSAQTFYTFVLENTRNLLNFWYKKAVEIAFTLLSGDVDTGKKGESVDLELDAE